jgi:hypothetical protein
VTFDAALEEAEIEAACDGLGLSAEDRAYVIGTHQALGNGLLTTMLARGCDYRGYVGVKLEMRAVLARGLGGEA